MEEVCCCFGLFCLRFDEQAEGGDFDGFDVGFGFLALSCWIGDKKMGNKRVVIWRLVEEKQPFFVMSRVVSVVMVIAQSDLGIVSTTNEVFGCVSRCNLSLFT